MLEKVLRIALLFDFYGALLTEKQRQCLELHFLNDLSLAEIADEFSVSRQAVHDILRRAEQILTTYENKLKLVERYQEEQQSIRQVYELFNGLPEHVHQLPDVKLAIEKLYKLLKSSKEV